MSARHPNRERLRSWLDTGEPRRVAAHIERCARCQEVLDEISALDDQLVADLHAATTPPQDLRERTHGGVDLRLRNEAALGLFLDLFAIAWDIAGTVLDPAVTERDPAHDGAPSADDIDGGSR